MTKITKDDIDKLILMGQDYEPQELKDIIAQLELEKQTPDGGDVIVFNGKQYPVMKATYNVIRKTTKQIVAKRFMKDSLLDALEKMAVELLNDETIKGDSEKMDKLSTLQSQIMLLKHQTSKLKRIAFWFSDHIPFIFNIIDAIDVHFYKKSWLKLCKLTFGDNYKDFAMGGLTPKETARVMRIFFRFREELSPDVPDALKKNSPLT